MLINSVLIIFIILSFSISVVIHGQLFDLNGNPNLIGHAGVNITKEMLNMDTMLIHVHDMNADTGKP